MNKRNKIIAGALCALALFTAFDHAMRTMQANECQRDTIECPDKLWWFG
jgi:hypothetical protein